MRTEIDLDAATQAGLLNEAQAIALRNFQAEQDGVPIATAEKFRLFGGYADLVSALGLALVFSGAIGFALAEQARSSLHMLVIPALALCSFFIARKVDMRASPALGTVLMIAFLGFTTVALPTFMIVTDNWSGRDGAFNGAIFVVSLLVATGIFWRAFRFPPTFAAAVAGGSLMLIEVLDNVLRNEFGMAHGSSAITTIPAVVALVLAIGTLLSAIWWDLTDIRRETERSQVAFWLHCTAGLLLTRALFSLLTGTDLIDGNLVLTGLAVTDLPWVILMVTGAAYLSLLLDRRSLLTGVLLPLVGIFGNNGVGPALGMLMAGAGLLFFNFCWIRLRIALLGKLPPKLSAQLPRTSLTLRGQRPSRRDHELAPSKASMRSRQ